MNTLLTFAGFVLLSALLMWWHVRSRPGAPAATAARCCPRCGKPLGESADSCPHCSAPVRAFEIVAAPIAKERSGADAGAMHAIVRADMCVGCGTCVDACPEPGAIFLVNKIAKVNLDACKGHGTCAAACPVSAIVVTTGEAVQVMEVPELDVNFQSNVPGLYVIGELGGRGLIKNAINEGKLALEHIASTLASDPFRGQTESGIADVIVVGSGPAGLSAAITAKAKGLRCVVIEQGSLIETIAKYPRRKLLLAEPVRTPLYGDLWVADSTKEELIQVWENVIRRAQLVVKTDCRVSDIRPGPGFFSIESPAGTFRARRVVLAMGRRGTPRKLGVPGEALDKVFYDVVEMEAFAGQRMLIVGGGDSAVESALGLAHQPGTTVTLSYRNDTFGRVKPRNAEKLEAARQAGRVEILLQSQVREIRRDIIVLDHQGTARLLPNDYVIVRIGGEAPYPFLERIGVRIVRKALAFEASAGTG